MSQEEGLARLEHQIANVLRAGVAVSAVVLTVGLAMSLAGAQRASKVLDAGVILLIAIPVVRILTSFVDAIRRRDRLLSGATAIVLLILAALLVYAK